MGLKTPVINGARQELPCLESPEVNGARQAISAVNKYVDGAWQKIWPMEEYFIQDGYLADGYGVATRTWQSQVSNDNYIPNLTLGSKDGYYSVLLSENFIDFDAYSGGGRIVFSPLIDLSKHKVIWIETTFTPMKSSSYYGVELSSTQTLLISNSNSVYDDGTTLASAEYYGQNAEGHGLYSIDLSALTGTGYLRFVITFEYSGRNSYSSSHEAKIYNIWME